MDSTEIVIKAQMEDMGHISSVIQGKKGDFLSIDQEGDFLVVIAKIPSKEFDNIKENLKNLLGNSFTMEFYKKA